MEIAILLVAGALSIIGFVLLYEDVQRRNGFVDYAADIAIILSGAAAFTWTMMNYAY